MKFTLLSGVSVIALAAGVAAGSPAEAMPLSAAKSVEAALYQSAVADGSKAALQAYLTRFPAGEYSAETLDQMIILIGQGQGFSNSGNPNAAGSPSAPGLGNGQGQKTGHY